MRFVAPWGQRVRYLGRPVMLSSTPPIQRVEHGATGTVVGSSVDQGFLKVQFDAVDGPVSVRESSLEEIQDACP